MSNLDNKDQYCGSLTNRKDLSELKNLFKLFENGYLTKSDMLDNLEVKGRRFYQLLALYRNNKLDTLYKNKRGKHRRTSIETTGKVIDELMIQRRIINDDRVDIKKYNYTYISEVIKNKHNVVISPATVARIAHKHGYDLKSKPTKKDLHTRKVLTQRIGDLLQHDSSVHKFAPLSGRKWYLIATIDDYSRLILYARLFESDTTWNHMLAVKHVALSYGKGCTYYTDNHSIFKYIRGRDSSAEGLTIISANTIKTQWAHVP